MILSVTPVHSAAMVEARAVMCCAVCVLTDAFFSRGEFIKAALSCDAPAGPLSRLGLRSSSAARGGRGLLRRANGRVALASCPTMRESPFVV